MDPIPYNPGRPTYSKGIETLHHSKNVTRNLQSRQLKGNSRSVPIKNVRKTAPLKKVHDEFRPQLMQNFQDVRRVRAEINRRPMRHEIILPGRMENLQARNEQLTSIGEELHKIVWEPETFLWSDEYERRRRAVPVVPHPPPP
jgi:hypothetical protein